MESQPQSPEFRNNLENIHTCIFEIPHLEEKKKRLYHASWVFHIL